jgi:hypothetical protein
MVFSLPGPPWKPVCEWAGWDSPGALQAFSISMPGAAASGYRARRSSHFHRFDGRQPSG